MPVPKIGWSGAVLAIPILAAITGWLAFQLIKSGSEQASQESASSEKVISNPSASGTGSVGKADRNLESNDNRNGDARPGISVHVTGLKSGSSRVFFAVFESPQGFPDPDQADWKTSFAGSSTDQQTCRLSFQPTGPSAIAVFQDLDGDGRLSKNLLGIPVEPYGFSGGARGIFGPPDFKEALVTPPIDGRLEVSLR